MCNHKNNIIKIVCAVLLHIFSMYLVVFLQNRAYSMCSTAVYMMVKFILRWFYLLVPICFMKVEHMTLKDIGITRNKPAAQVGIGVSLGSVAAIAIVGLTVLLGFKEQLGKPLYEEGWQYIIYFFYTIFAVGLFEEFFFRGYLFKKLLDIKESKWFAILFSSIIFGMCHFIGNGGMIQAIPQVFFATVVGVFYCLLREKIRNCSLVSLIFMHGMYDFLIAFIIFIL